MRKYFILVMLTCCAVLCADDYIDDIYFTPSDAHREATAPKPKYKDGMKEIIFIEDSVPHNTSDTLQSQQHEQHQPTTVKAIIKR